MAVDERKREWEQQMGGSISMRKKVTRSNEWCHWLARVTSTTCRHLPPQLDLLPTNNNKLRKEIADLDLFSLTSSSSRYTTSHKEMVIKERLGPADRSEPH